MKVYYAKGLTASTKNDLLNEGSEDEYSIDTNKLEELLDKIDQNENVKNLIEFSVKFILKVCFMYGRVEYLKNNIHFLRKKFNFPDNEFFCSQLLEICVMNSQIDSLKFLLTQLPNYHDLIIDNIDLLYKSIDAGNIEMVKYIFSIDNNQLITRNTLDNNEYSLILETAVDRNQIEIVKFLLSIKNEQQIFEEPFLSAIVAAENNNLECLKLLLENEDERQRIYLWEHILEIFQGADEYNNLEVLEYLLNLDDERKISFKDGKSPYLPRNQNKTLLLIENFLSSYVDWERISNSLGKNDKNDRNLVVRKIKNKIISDLKKNLWLNETE